MATLTMPNTTSFLQVQFGLRSNTQTFISPLNRATQTLELPGSLWFANYTLKLLNLTGVAEWQGFIVDLMGSSGRFLGFDPGRETPRGSYDSGLDAPLVDGASQTGATLATDGWRTSIPGLLLPGDYFEVTASAQKQLHMVTSSVGSDALGAATISFKPPLRNSPLNNAALTINSPRVTMMLVDDNQSLWSIDVNQFVRGFSFSGIEVF